MHENGLNCWNVRDGKSLLAEQDDDSKDTAASAAMLRDKIKAIGAGYVTINLSGVNKKNRKAAEALKVRTYTIATGYNEPNKVTAPLASYDNKEVEKLRAENEALKLAQVEIKYQQKLNELEKKIEGLEAGDDDTPLGRVETLLLPIITNMFTNSATPAPTINGIREESLIEQWLSVDPAAVDVLEKIVSLAVNKPDMYKTYKPILLNL
jgi:hypothetical protein